MDVLLNWKTAFQVGQRLIGRFTEDTVRFKDALEIIKIICKDFWTTYSEHASKYVAFTCGLIRGGLSTLGIESRVIPEASSVPVCKLQMMTQRLQDAVTHGRDCSCAKPCKG
uniref:Uncharacterized protein n=1 Tax=Mus spicilegus TaxID=10103 RepID=A0A8C6HQ59_MUSSI